MPESLVFPLPMHIRAVVLHSGALALMVDLASNEESLWIALVADGKDEDGPVIGYVRMEKRLTQRPGLTTYAAVEVRPSHDPPPNPASFRTLFRWPSLGACVSLLQWRTVPRG